MLSLDQHEFRTIFCESCGYEHTFPVYCGDRFCPTCSIKRSHRVRMKLETLLSKIILTSGQKYRHLTLTIPNYEDPRKAVIHLVKSFRELRRLKFWKKSVAGGSFVIEITGQPSAWHAHIHCIIQSRYIEWEDIKTAWTRISGGCHVYIQLISADNIIRYLTKYITKPSPDDHHDNLLSNALRDCRLFQPFGSWHNIIITIPRRLFKCPKCGNTSWRIDLKCTSKYMEKYGIPFWPGS